jgi:hypothetical protein
MMARMGTSLEGEIVSWAGRLGAHGKAAVAVEYVVQRITIGYVYEFAAHVFSSRQRPRLRLLGGPRTLKLG